ncbi:MAG: hypothetical protein ACE5F2_02685 [Candidatus Paceibacteria bacterium]
MLFCQAKSTCGKTVDYSYIHRCLIDILYIQSALFIFLECFVKREEVPVFKKSIMILVLAIVVAGLLVFSTGSKQEAYANDKVDNAVTGLKNTTGGWTSALIHPAKGLSDDSRSGWEKTYMFIPDLLVGGTEAAIRTAVGPIDFVTAAFKEDNIVEDAPWEYCLVDS